jgi:hypothetical protein
MKGSSPKSAANAFTELLIEALNLFETEV